MNPSLNRSPRRWFRREPARERRSTKLCPQCGERFTGETWNRVVITRTCGNRHSWKSFW